MFKKIKLLKSKLLIICTLPLLLISTVLSWENIAEQQAFQDEQLAQERKTLLSQKENELRSLVLLALSSLEEILSRPPSPERDQAVKTMLDQFSFGSGTYFFINSYDLYAIANGRRGPFPPKQLRINRSKLQPGELHPLESMIESAKNGGGFTHYTAFKSLDDENQAPKLAYAQNIPGYDWLIGTGYFIDDIEVAIQNKIAAFEQASKTLLYRTIGLTSLFFITSFVVCYIGVMRAFKPLDNMDKALKDIAHGEGDLTHRLKIENDDEIGRCAASFNEFSEKIRQLVKKVSSEAQQINNATLSLDESSKTSLTFVNQQRDKTEHLSQVVSDMVASAQGITENGTKASQAAGDVNVEATKTSQGLVEAVKTLQGLDEDINQSSQAIDRLEQETDQIGNVLEVIQQIAEQTNLLALNAAIEAARAGEQGRGFAVVADEVRTLASRTQSSTEEIREMIDKLQSGARQAVEAMNISKDSSLQARTVAEESQQSLLKVSESIGIINEVNALVASTVIDQTSATEDLNVSLQDLYGLSGDTEKEIRSVAETSQTLKTNVAELTNEISVFSV
jgi:methyl-accepting chemotaxis protein